MGWWDDVKEAVGRKVNEALLATASSVEDVRADAAGETLASWRTLNCLTAGACAAGNLLPGPAALAALSLEIPVLLNIVSRAALGTGIIVNGDAADEDYPLILAHWSGALKLDDDLKLAVQAQLSGAAAAAVTSAAGVAAAKAIAGAAGAKAAVKAGAKLNALVLSSAMMAVAGKQGAVHIGTKLAAANLAAKIISSLPARLVPFVGAGVAAAVNAWFVNGMINAAESYYRFIGDIGPAPAVPPPPGGPAPAGDALAPAAAA